MKTWTPLWSTIVTSTLWGESKEVRILFVTMLAIKDSQGVVIASLEGLARLANLKTEECREALRVLESPDERSESTQEFQGRRLQKVEGGWLILNHLKYREMVQKVKHQMQKLEWQREQRIKERLGMAPRKRPKRIKPGGPTQEEKNKEKAFTENEIDKDGLPLEARPVDMPAPTEVSFGEDL